MTRGRGRGGRKEEGTVRRGQRYYSVVSGVCALGSSRSLLRDDVDSVSNETGVGHGCGLD